MDNIAFHAPGDCAFAFFLDCAFDHIVLCGFVIPHSVDGHDVEASIGLSVAPTVRKRCPDPTFLLNL